MAITGKNHLQPIPGLPEVRLALMGPRAKVLRARQSGYSLAEHSSKRRPRLGIQVVPPPTAAWRAALPAMPAAVALTETLPATLRMPAVVAAVTEVRAALAAIHGTPTSVTAVKVGRHSRRPSIACRLVVVAAQVRETIPTATIRPALEPRAVE